MRFVEDLLLPIFVALLEFFGIEAVQYLSGDFFFGAMIIGVFVYLPIAGFFGFFETYHMVPQIIFNTIFAVIALCIGAFILVGIEAAMDWIFYG